MYLPDGVPCASHPQAMARVVCARCGSYACDDCTAGGLRSDSLCLACDEHVAGEQVGRVNGVARVLRYALATYAVGTLVIAIAKLVEPAREVAPGVRVFSEQNDRIFMATALLSAATELLFFATAIVWCVWFRRANRALAARSMELEFGPNAWGWYFVPIMSLFKPYASMVELHTRSHGTMVAPTLYPVWWGAWLLPVLFTPFTVLSFQDVPPLVTAVVALLNAVAGATAYKIVTDITRALARPGTSQSRDQAWSAAFA